MSWRSMFTDHPASVGETYGQHMVSASGFAVRMFLGGAACLVHALLPFLFEKTGSTMITRLYDRMVTNRHRMSQSTAEPSMGAVARRVR
ncbi:MAG: DUF6356 family protein [Alphaproteobacteria bacterium]|nr:DUF6356 family protein [Alphaproteobacteria bacterium]